MAGTNTTSAVVTSTPTATAIGVNDLKKQLSEYGEYVNRTLRPKLKEAIDLREEAECEISEYVKLGEIVTRLLDERDATATNTSTATTTTEEGDIDATNANNAHPRKRRDDAPLRGVVDVCHGAIYCDVVIPNTRVLYVNVGLGFHVEMTLREASSFVEKRARYLEQFVLKHRIDVERTITKDVRDAIVLMEELSGELMDM
jgi:hypothetical protein